MWEVINDRSSTFQHYKFPPSIVSTGDNKPTLYTFGGNENQRYTNSLHKLSNLDRELEIKCEEAGGNIPSERVGASLAMYNNESIYLFGGYSNNTFYQDLFIFNIQTKMWENVKSKGTPPSARIGAAVIINDKKLILFGGYNQDGYLCDSFILSLKSMEWKEIQPNSRIPSPRVGANFIMTTNNKIYLIGGWDRKNLSTDFFEWVVKDNSWRNVHYEDERLVVNQPICICTSKPNLRKLKERKSKRKEDPNNEINLKYEIHQYKQESESIILTIFNEEDKSKLSEPLLLWKLCKSGIVLDNQENPLKNKSLEPENDSNNKSKKAKFQKEEKEVNKKDETEEESNANFSNIENEMGDIIEINERDAQLLESEIVELIQPIINCYIERLLKLKISFNDIKNVFIEDNHYFLTTLFQFIPYQLDKLKVKNRELVNFESIKIGSYLQFIRNQLLDKATSRFALTSAVIEQMKTEYYSAQMKHVVEQQQTVKFLAVNISLEIFTDINHRIEPIRQILQNTFNKNIHEIDAIRPKLSDALSDERKEIFSKLAPLEKANQNIANLLQNWEDKNFVPTGQVILRPTEISRESIMANPNIFTKLLPEICLEEYLRRYAELQGWIGQKIETLPVFNEDEFDSIQDRVQNLRKLASTLEDFLYAEDPQATRLSPKCTMLVRLFTKEQMQVQYNVNKQEISRISKMTSLTEEQKTEEIDGIKKEQKFIRKVLKNWKEKKKLSNRNCIWSLTFRSRQVALSQMTEGEINLLYSKLAEVHILREEKESEFQLAIIKEINEITEIIKIAMKLNILNIEEKKALYSRLNVAPDNLFEIPLDEFPRLKARKRFKNAIEKWKSLEEKKKELRFKKPKQFSEKSDSFIEFPKIEIKIEKMTKDCFSELLKNYEIEIKSAEQKVKSTDSKDKKKLKIHKDDLKKLKEKYKNYQEILQEWEGKGKLTEKSKNQIFISIPKNCKFSQISKFEKKIYLKQQKKKMAEFKEELSQTESKIESCKTQAMQFFNDYKQKLKKEIEILEEIRNLDNKIQIIKQRSLRNHKGSYLSRPNLFIVKLENLTQQNPTKNNAKIVLEQWKQLVAQMLDSITPDTKYQVQENYFQAKKLAMRQFEPFEQEKSNLNDYFQELEQQHQFSVASIPEAKKIIKFSDSKLNSNLISSEVEKNGLLILTNLFENENLMKILPSDEQIVLLDFFMEIKGSLEFNSRLTQITNKEAIPFGISQDAIDFAKTYSFKSRHLDKLSPLTDKLFNVWNEIKAGNQNIARQDKLTLKQLGILRTMEKWGKDLYLINRFFQNSVLSTNEKVLQHPMFLCLSNALQSHHQLRSIYQSIQQIINLDETYQSGDYLLAIWTRKLQTMQGNRPPRTFSFLMSFTKYEHTAVIYKNQNTELGPIGEPRLSHMFREYHDSELSLEDLACADIFRISVPKLVTDSEIRDSLTKHLGDQWEQVVQERYYKLESSLHSEKQTTLGGITNPISRVLSIGTAAVMPWTRMRKTNMNFQKIHSTIFSNEERKKGDIQMTCSEFAAKSTIAALIELNEQLTKELGVSKTIINLPFPAKEKLKTLQPDRLRQLIQDSNALIQVPLPPFIANLIKL